MNLKGLNSVVKNLNVVECNNDVFGVAKKQQKKYGRDPVSLAFFVPRMQRIFGMSLAAEVWSSRKRFQCP